MSLDLTPIDHLVRAHKPVGSRETCNPPPMDTDEDHLLLIESEDLEAALDLLEDHGYTQAEPYTALYATDPSSDWGCNFLSLRNGEINLLITTKDAFYRRFVAATSVAKRFNLMDKEDRVALFQAVLYGNSCGEVESAR